MDTIEDFKVLPVRKDCLGERLVRPAEEWEFTYHGKYWIVRNAFRDLEQFKDILKCYPIEDMNNEPGVTHPNPFIVHHIPYWIFFHISEEVRNFIILNHFKTGKDFTLPNERLSKWGNIFSRKDSRPLRHSNLPHVDFSGESGFIANLWLTEHEPGETGTKIFSYYGDYDERGYDFQYDPKHHLHQQWLDHYGSGLDLLDGWKNFDADDMWKWKFKCIGYAPAEYGTMTIYNANIPHTPWIPDSVDYRWSHCFDFKYNPIGNVLRGNIPNAHLGV